MLQVHSSVTWNTIIGQLRISLLNLLHTYRDQSTGVPSSGLPFFLVPLFTDDMVDGQII